MQTTMVSAPKNGEQNVEDKMHKTRVRIKGFRTVCNAMIGVFTDEQRQKIRKQRGRVKRGPTRPFGRRRGEYDMYL